MSDEVAVRTVFLKPGFVCMPGEPACLCVVVSSGVAVTMFDRSKKRGGVGHYTYPYRETRSQSTPLYACASLVSLVRMLEESGSHLKDIEAWMYGGASNPEAPGYVADLAENNVRVGKELLVKLGVALAGEDTGGRQGRKVVFHTGTGESVVAKVDRLRQSDWYHLDVVETES